MDLHVHTTEDFLNISDLNMQIENQIKALSERDVVAFVDGSCDASGEKTAFGVIIFSDNNNKTILYKSFTKQSEDFLLLRNVSAELEGVKDAINWAIQYKKDKITIYYDYQGIEDWATGRWKAKNTITQKYVQFMQEKRRFIEIEFVKVPAHSGVKYNEEADSIAKKALLLKGYKTYNDGSVYFVGYSAEDWRKIIERIDTENAGIDAEMPILRIVINQQTIDRRVQLRVIHDKNVVTINCYQNSNSYVQGKQTVLFQKIITTAIELSGNRQSVIETLNIYHALTITSSEVETIFDQKLPNYKHESNNNYRNLLTAVYNTMLTGYMPDYTCLVTPIFRAYEYYLHKILGDTMGLKTETENKTNNFSFFTRNNSGLYECSSRNRNLLSQPQLDYLNNLYTIYNGVRHPYSHWSASDSDNSVIEDINVARGFLNDGLDLIDQYYTLFS